MKAYEIVKKARDVQRLSTIEIINALCSEFIEFHGDRRREGDKAVVGGVGLMDDEKAITIIGIQNGRNTEANIRRNFDSSGSAGYRRAEGCMKQAERFQRPILTL